MEPVSGDQILTREQGRGNIDYNSCSADHEKDRQPYPVDAYSTISDNHTYIHVQNRGEMGRSLVATVRMVMMRSIGYK